MTWSYKRYDANNGGKYCAWKYQVFWTGSYRHWPIPVRYELWLQYTGIVGAVDDLCNVYLNHKEDVAIFLLRWS